MASHLYSSISLVLTILFLFSVSINGDFSIDNQSDGSCYSSTQFLSSVKSSIDQIRDITSLVSQYVNGFGDFRLSNAINDCVDLLDFSADELSWTASATQNINPIHSTGNKNSDLKAWLSAALGNQETCLEGFEGTNSFVKPILGSNLQQLNSLLQNVLGMVCPSSSSKPSPPGRTGRKLMRANGAGDEFPSWIKASDRRLLQASAGGVSVNAIVAADGSGTYRKVMDAVLAAPDHSTSRYVIYVKRGIYKENVEIKKKKWNLMIIGDGMNATVISGNRSFVDGWTTFRSATFAVAGRGFIARDITFENTAGPEKHQAVALRSDSDLSAFFRCGIHGYQDTLYAHSLRQFYRECHISGTVDFIFGNGAVILQKCQILAKKGLPNQKNTITAQGRIDQNQTTGFSIQFSNFSADSDLINSLNATQTYLGRPWKQYSRTVIMKSYLSSMIRPEGWLPWDGDFALATLYYGEYMNYGEGAGLDSRVKWPGFHPIYNSTEANGFTVASFLDGNLWLPSTGVTFTAGLEI